MELFFEHWWQFAIIIGVLIIGAIALSKSLESTLEAIKGAALALIQEPLFNSPARRATAVNILMLIFSGVVMIALTIPTVLVQLGLIEERGYFLILVGIVQFWIVGGGSGYGIYIFTQTAPAFRDDAPPPPDQSGQPDERRAAPRKQAPPRTRRQPRRHRE